MSSISSILNIQQDQEEPIYDAILQDNDPEPPIPTKETLDEHIQRNLQQEDENYKLQNQTHGEACNDCIKAVNQTPNPRSHLRYCKYHGVMVSKFQKNCAYFKPASTAGQRKDPFGI